MNGSLSGCLNPIVIGPSGRETKMKRQSKLAHAILASFGIVAIAALAGCGSGSNQQAQATPANMTMATSAATAQLPPGQEPMANGAAQASQGAPAGAPQFAQVVAVQPITQSATTSKPRQVCRDEQVAVPETYKDQHQIGGAVVGGLAGALAGHMVGGGKGKTLATVAGAAGGAFAGHEIQKNHQENNATKTETRNVCHTVTDKSTTTKTVGYDVTYTLNGQAGHIRMDHNPGVGTGLPVRNGEVVASDKQGGSYYR
ncbi:MAG: glycine zipper 2TM domain-containing protein [Xanthomonadaceae bacterium]|nr:glycine zipper 2TM domain-containing protein [Xanthomonadaceae bacterium]